jgi:hypothetical protein
MPTTTTTSTPVLVVSYLATIVSMCCFSADLKTAAISMHRDGADAPEFARISASCRIILVKTVLGMQPSEFGNHEFRKL